MSRFSSYGFTMVLVTTDGYWLTLKCLYERTAGVYAMRTVAMSAADAELGREVFQAIRDVAPCDPGKIDALLEQFARDYPDPEKWLEKSNMTVSLWRIDRRSTHRIWT